MQKIGVFGIVHPTVLEKFDLRSLPSISFRQYLADSIQIPCLDIRNECRAFPVDTLHVLDVMPHEGQDRWIYEKQSHKTLSIGKPVP